MRLPFVSLRRYEDAVAGQERLREERDQARKDHKSAQEAAKTAAALFTRADNTLAAISKTNECLTADLDAARKQLAAQDARTDLVPRADFEEEKKRADHLQQRLDQATGLDDPAIAAGAAWQDRREQKMRFDK